MHNLMTDVEILNSGPERRSTDAQKGASRCKVNDDFGHHRRRHVRRSTREKYARQGRENTCSVKPGASTSISLFNQISRDHNSGRTMSVAWIHRIRVVPVERERREWICRGTHTDRSPALRDSDADADASQPTCRPVSPCAAT